MSYTPPSGNAVNATWLGTGTYTPPAGDAVNFSFVTGRGIATGAGCLGIPRALASQSVGIIVAAGCLGTPAALGCQQVAWATGSPALGVPTAEARLPLSAWTRGLGALGLPGATGRSGFQGTLVGAGALGMPTILGGAGYRATVFGAPALGMPRSQAYALPAAAAGIPPGVVHYFCMLTGAPDGLADLVLPISNFSVRHRPDAPSYYSITIPSYAYVTDLAARPHGEIVIWSEQSGVTEELSRGDLGQVAIYRGPNSQSITIDGNSDQAPLPHLTYVLTDVLYVNSTFTGENRLRITPRAAIRPGDFVRYQDLNFEVGTVTWSVAVSASGMAATMELANLPITA